MFLSIISPFVCLFVSFGVGKGGDFTDKVLRYTSFFTVLVKTSISRTFFRVASVATERKVSDTCSRGRKGSLRVLVCFESMFLGHVCPHSGHPWRLVSDLRKVDCAYYVLILATAAPPTSLADLSVGNSHRTQSGHVPPLVTGPRHRPATSSTHNRRQP